MGKITDIKAGIETRLAAILPAYTKLAYQVNIEDNKFKGNSKGYAVIPSINQEVDGVVGAFTLDHAFQITLTDSYNDGARSQVGDNLKITRISELMDDVLSAYSDFLVNKSNIDASILVINQLNTLDPEFIDEDKVIKVPFIINIKYRTNI